MGREAAKEVPASLGIYDDAVAEADRLGMMDEVHAQTLAS